MENPQFVYIYIDRLFSLRNHGFSTFFCLFVCVCVLAGIMNEHVMMKPTITDTRWIWCATRAMNQVLLIVTIIYDKLWLNVYNMVISIWRTHRRWISSLMEKCPRGIFRQTHVLLLLVIYIYVILCNPIYIPVIYQVWYIYIHVYIQHT